MEGNAIYNKHIMTMDKYVRLKLPQHSLEQFYSRGNSYFENSLATINVRVSLTAR